MNSPEGSQTNLETTIRSSLQYHVDQLKDKLISCPETLIPICDNLFLQVQQKTDSEEITSPLVGMKDKITSFVDTMNPEIIPNIELEAPNTNSSIPGMEAIQQMSGLFSSLFGGGSSPIMQFMNSNMESIQKFQVKKEDILAWRETSEMQQILTLDPRARYMYLSPTPLLPSLSGLYLEVTLDTNPTYILFTSSHSAPLIYRQNILTSDFIQKVWETESQKLDPMMKAILSSQFMSSFNIDSYWKFVDSKLDPPSISLNSNSTNSNSTTIPKRNIRRPIYIED